MTQEDKHLQSHFECHGELGLLFPTTHVLIHSYLSRTEPSYASCPCVTIYHDPLNPEKYLNLDNKLYGPSTHNSPPCIMECQLVQY